MQKHMCKHFNGVQNTHCRLGIAYASVTPEPENIEGRTFRLPCMDMGEKRYMPMNETQKANYAKRGTCASYEEPTAEELKEYKEKREAHLEQFVKIVLPLIAQVKKEHKGKSWSGKQECPVCKGVLHLSHASVNGHVHGKCETENCLSWME